MPGLAVGRASPARMPINATTIIISMSENPAVRRHRDEMPMALRLFPAGASTDASADDNDLDLAGLQQFVLLFDLCANIL